MGFLSKLFGTGTSLQGNDSLRNIAVVVGDASVTIQKVIELTFQPTGATVHCFSDSESLVRFLEENTINVVILDSSLMPRNGYDTSLYIKSHDRLKNTPVFILVPTLRRQESERLKRSMANGVIPKPFDSKTLLKSVQEALQVP